MEALSLKKMMIYSSFTLSSDDVASISLLYAPLIGSAAAGLYFSLQSLLERNNLMAENYIHQDIFDMFDFKEKDFMRARFQLEGIGLLKTYEKDQDYVYVLCPPLSAKNFLKDATLGLYLYSKVGKDVFDKLFQHFKIVKLDKSILQEVTKNFEDIFTSQINEDVSFSKFQYLLGRKPNSLKIVNRKFDFDQFKKQINLDFLETGITKTFIDQITNLAFVYAFDELQMAGLYNESINKSGLFDVRILKKKANNLYNYIHHMEAPKLLVKEEENIDSVDLIHYLENASPSVLLENMMQDFPPKYLSIIEEIYAQIDLPRGVLNCMIIKVLKEKSGELPALAYFKKMSQTWIENNIFATADAIKFATNYNEVERRGNSKQTIKYKAGGADTL